MNKPEKNKEYIVDIIDNGIEGEGIAKIDDFTVFVQGAIKGEKIKILIIKVQSSYAYGKIIEILQPSKERKCVDCKTYKRCGGCNLRHINYEETLNIKQNKVQNLVNKMLKNKIKVQKTIGMDNPFFYRNKAQYPVGIDKNGVPQIGIFANRTHEIIPMEKCYIQNELAESIAKDIFKYWTQNKLSVYDEKSQKGLLRHIVIKAGIKSNEYMAVIVINGDKFEKEKEFVEYITSKFPQVKTVVKNINKKNTNVILGEKNVNLHGNGYINDTLGEYSFKISPLSFYQVNPIQAEELYNIGVDAAKLDKNDIVFDLYCGIGTITLFMSKYCKKVYGIEIVKEAIDMAKENAKLNNVENTEFLVGDVEFAFDKLINEQKIIPNVVMVDPPRRGLDNTTINNLIKIAPERIVYISCNPATLVRDLAMLEDYFEVKTITPVDMFPWTSHVECVACLNLKG